MATHSREFTWRDLASKDADRVERAAGEIHASGNADDELAEPGAREALLGSIGRGNRTAASVLLLGHTASTAPNLKELIAKHGDEPVKLRPWSRMVPLKVAAEVALSRLGDNEARYSLLEGGPQYDSSVRIFLLDVLSDIDAPEIWHSLAEYLRDTAEIPEGVPSGANRRRVCDHAVDAFLARFNLPVSFDRNEGGRYSVQDIDETAKLFESSVPR